MRKILLLCVVALAACHEPNVPTEDTQYDLGWPTPLQVVVIGECEYLYGNWGSATVLTHKGDCSNDDHDYMSIRE